jgi:DNA damage-binding protein 1
VYGLKEGELNLELTIPVYGRIVLLKAFRPASESGGDFVFVTTEKYDFCVIRWGQGGLETVATGHLEDRACRPVDAGQLGAVGSNLIALHLFQGLIKVIPITDEGGALFKSTAFNVRVEELQICSMAMLKPSEASATHALAILHQTVGGGVEVKSYRLDGEERSLVDGPFSFEADEDSRMLVAVPEPRGGLLVLADECIQYYRHQPQGTPLSLGVTMNRTRLTSCTPIDGDGFRFLIGDNHGRLLVLLLLCHDRQDNRSGVRELKLEALGATCISSCLAYLDAGLVFVGSKVGDSQLVRLSAKRVGNAFVESLQAFASVAPLVDLCVTGLDSSGQRAIVAGAGAMQEGRLAVVRRGVAAGLLAEGEDALPLGITGIWPVGVAEGAHAYQLVCSGYTTSAQISVDLASGRVEPVEGALILASSPSLLVGQHGPLLFQVCPASISYGCTGRPDASNRKIWIPQPGGGGGAVQILGAAQLDDHLAVVLSTALLLLFTLSPQGIHQRTALQLPSCPSAVTLTRRTGGRAETLTAVVALWSLALVSVDLPAAAAAAPTPTVILDSLPAVCRSLRVCHFKGGSAWVFAGLANGSIVYGLAGGGGGGGSALSQVRRAHIGQQPVAFVGFPRQADRLLALSDRPTLVLEGHGRRPHFLSIVAAGLEERIALAAPLPAAGTASPLLCLLTTPKGGAGPRLLIATLDGSGSECSARLHTERLLLGETVRRVSHLPAEGVFAAIAVKRAAEAVENFSSLDTSSVALVDDTTFELLDRRRLPAGELVQCQLAIPSTSLLLVGTALLSGPDGGNEPVGGRLLTFSVSRRRLALVGAQHVGGTVYAAAWLSDRLIALVNGQTCVFRQRQQHQQADAESDAESARWRLASSTHHGQVLGIHIDVLGPDLLSVGDMMRSANLLRLDLSSDRLHEIARDHSPAWASCVRFIDPGHLLVADDRGNLCQLVRSTDPNFVTERLLLEPSGAFHLGSLVNALVPGSLAGEQPDQQVSQASPLASSFIFGTSSGAIGAVSVIRAKETFALLQALQASILAVSQPAGLLSHAAWRAPALPTRISIAGAAGSTRPDHPCFIDGDVVQRFPGLPADLQRVIVEGGKAGEVLCKRLPFGKTVADIVDLVDDLGSRH